LRAGKGQAVGLPVEVVLVWMIFVVVTAEILATYSRLPARALYHVSGSGIEGGLSRAVLFTNFPVALVALAVLALVYERLPARGYRITAIVACALCAVMLWPGVVKESDLDARPVNAFAAVGVLLAILLTDVVARAGGRVVNKVLIAASVDIEREIYFAVLLDRATAGPIVVASTEGGVEIEAVAEKSPEKILREKIDPLAGLQTYQTRKLAKQLGFESSQLKAAGKLFEGLYRTFVACDCSMVEVNPLVVTPKGEVLALDAKFNFDDNALYRHPELAALRDIAEEDPREVEASEHGLNYIGLDGNIACLVNGAGLAMATMDMIKHAGGSPANFLDVGGGASPERIATALKLVLSDAKVKAVLVNIFAGINRCDWVAKGVVQACETVDVKVPLVVRLAGTNVEEGRKILADSGVEMITAETLAEAANKAVAACNAATQEPARARA
jgi:succinyl-CoA synthetase beta subunit